MAVIVTTLTREALYEAVWHEPARTVAARLGISDVGLKKVCANAAVPVPERGYWARLAAGKQVVKPKLPPRDPGAPLSVTIGQDPHFWRPDPAAELAVPLPDPPIFDEPIEAVRARVAQRVGKFRAIRNLESPSASIRRLLDDDERRRVKQAGRSWASSWDAPLFDSPFEQRRLRILNSIALGLAKGGVKLETRGMEARELWARVGSQHAAFTLDHPNAKKTMHGEWSTRPGPVDVLSLQINGSRGPAPEPTTWKDAPGAKLEDQIGEIVISLIVAGEAQYRAHEVAHHQWLIQRRAENEAELQRRRLDAERLAREKRERAEQARRELLLKQARDWRTAVDIRSFVTEVMAVQSQDVNDPGAMETWAAWALAEADTIDPTKRPLNTTTPSVAD